MACSEKLPRPKFGPTFSAEEEDELEQKRSSMQQEMEEALQKLREWKKQRSVKNDHPPRQ